MKKIKRIIIKKEFKPLTFIKDTPVLPVVTKRNVSEILDLLEELDADRRFFIDSESAEE